MDATLEMLMATIRSCHHLNIKGESYRLKEKRKAGLLGRPSPSSNELQEAPSQSKGSDE